MAAERQGAEQLQIEERRVRVYDLRIRGLSYAKIADQLGVSVGTAYSDAKAVMDRITAEADEKAEQVRKAELHRLDIAQAAIWSDVETGDLDAIDTLLKLQARRAKLLGLDAPERHDVLSISSQATPAEAAKLVREAFREFKPADLTEPDAGDPSGA